MAKGAIDNVRSFVTFGTLTTNSQNKETLLCRSVTSKYPEVPQSIQKYLKVPISTSKYTEVSKITSKYLKVHGST